MYLPRTLPASVWVLMCFDDGANDSIPSDIAALSRNRALLFNSGNPPGLLRLHRYPQKPYADEVAASEAFSAPLLSLVVLG